MLSNVQNNTSTCRIDIEFKDITCAVKNKNENSKYLLKAVSGRFKSGELCAIMGPSGAGKTTLLNTLTGFQRSNVSGIITRNGSPKWSQKNSCYILQDDQLMPLFTVWETMMMAADLKLGKTRSVKDKQLMILSILDNLGLLACKNTKCGQISGGQKKRVSIALELIDNPSVMFLDEPTTGLDISSAVQCVKMLKNLAKGGRTIICTIHQPSGIIYEKFDYVYYLAKGECIYQGPSGDTINFMASVGFICPQYHSPVDYFMEIANGDYGDYISLLSEAALEAYEKNRVETEFVHKISKNNTENAVSEIFKFQVLIRRTFLQINRDWTMSYLRAALHLIVGIFIGLTFLKAGNDGSKTFKNFGFFSSSFLYVIYTSLMPSILNFPSEVAVLKKERFNNWYQLKTYYIAFMISDIPIQIIYTLIYTTFAYTISGQPLEIAAFSRTSLILIFLALVSSTEGLLIGTLTDPVNGTFIGAVYLAAKISLAGAIIFFNHMPRAMYWFSSILYSSYGFEGLIQAVYDFNRADLPCPDSIDYCHYRVPKVILHETGIDRHTYWNDVGFLFGNFLVYRLIAFLALKRRLQKFS